ncbi:hypothetical protein CHELA17_61676 [Chelatococcus asaccharovorans]|nr:hypothetical protein CHELA17_61676 [Chelatococcus asaccharovorans]
MARHDRRPEALYRRHLGTLRRHRPHRTRRPHLVRGRGLTFRLPLRRPLSTQHGCCRVGLYKNAKLATANLARERDRVRVHNLHRLPHLAKERLKAAPRAPHLTSPHRDGRDKPGHDGKVPPYSWVGVNVADR